MSRVYSAALREKIMSAADAAGFIRPGMRVAFGGFSSAGYPKAVPGELRRRLDAGEALALDMLSGTSIHQLDGLLADGVARRAPLFESRALRARVNGGGAHYVEQQIGKSIRLLHTGAFGKIDVAVVEALMITEEGAVVPTSSVNYLPHFLELADKVIIEVNRHLPEALRGYHDILVPGRAPGRMPIPLTEVNSRIGRDCVLVDPAKVVAIVETNLPDELSAPTPPSPVLDRIAGHLVEVLQKERAANWPGGLPPVQTGIGALAKSIVGAFEQAEFPGLRFFCGALHDSHMQLFAKGRVEAMCATSAELSDGMAALLAQNAHELRGRLALRNSDLINEAETIGRLGIVALNSALEVDIYGNVNASHIAGTKVVNGLGGGAQFAQNAGLSVLLLPAASKKGAISAVVPMAAHVDITEHDIDIVITEHGAADLRGRDDGERAELMIQTCAAPEYRDALWRYLYAARKKTGGHHPQDMAEAARWHARLLETGTMLE